jgi:hypothetical protein
MHADVGFKNLYLITTHIPHSLHQLLFEHLHILTHLMNPPKKVS